MKSSPVNSAVGKMLGAKRAAAQLDVQSAALALQISSTYLRAIEAGNQALPAYSVNGLMADYGMSWTHAAQLVATVSYLNVRKDDQFDVALIVQRSRTLEATSGSVFHQQLTILLERASRALSPDNDGDYQQVIDQIAVHFASPPPSGVEQAGAHQPRPSPRENINPLIGDILDGLAESLAMVQPHINQTFTQSWEQKNRDRVSALFGYVDSQDSLLESFDYFDWKLLLNAHAPRLLLLVGDLQERGSGSLKRAFIDKLRRMTRAYETRKAHLVEQLASQISIYPAQPLKQAAEDCLMFDFVTRQMPDINETAEAHDAHIKTQRYQRFANAWIYALRSNIVGGGEEDIHHVGFMDAFNLNARATYGVSLGTRHVECWLSLFQRLGPSE